MLLHVASSDVSSLPLIYLRQMRQEYLQELYHFSLTAAAAKSTVRWCVSGPAVQRLLKSFSAPGETNKLYSTASTRFLNRAPWLCQIKSQPITDRLPISAHIPGHPPGRGYVRVGVPGAGAAAAGAAPTSAPAGPGAAGSHRSPGCRPLARLASQPSHLHQRPCRDLRAQALSLGELSARAWASSCEGEAVFLLTSR